MTLIYFPFTLAYNEWWEILLIIPVMIVHRFLEAYYDNQEISADQFAAQLLKELYGKQKAMNIIDTYMRHMRQELAGGAGRLSAGRMRELESRLKGFEEFNSDIGLDFIKRNKKTDRLQVSIENKSTWLLKPIITLSAILYPSQPRGETVFFALIVMWIFLVKQALASRKLDRINKELNSFKYHQALCGFIDDLGPRC